MKQVRIIKAFGSPDGMLCAFVLLVATPAFSSFAQAPLPDFAQKAEPGPPADSKVSDSKTTNSRAADSATSDAKASDSKAAAAKKADPVQEAWQRLRTLSVADAIDWARQHGVSVIVIILAAFLILSVANRLHDRLVRLLAS